MTDATTTSTDIMPSATIGDEAAEEVAWNALSRDEQVRRYRAVLGQAACDTISNDSMNDVLAAARQRVAKRRDA